MNASQFTAPFSHARRLGGAAHAEHFSAAAIVAIDAPRFPSPYGEHYPGPMKALRVVPGLLLLLLFIPLCRPFCTCHSSTRREAPRQVRRDLQGPAVAQRRTRSVSRPLLSCASRRISVLAAVLKSMYRRSVGLVGMAIRHFRNHCRLTRDRGTVFGDRWTPR